MGIFLKIGAHIAGPQELGQRLVCIQKLHFKIITLEEHISNSISLKYRVTPFILDSQCFLLNHKKRVTVMKTKTKHLYVNGIPSPPSAPQEIVQMHLS